LIAKVGETKSSTMNSPAFLSVSRTKSHWFCSK